MTESTSLPEDHAQQIQRLIFLNEQANARSHGLEKMVKRFEALLEHHHVHSRPASRDHLEAQSQPVSFPAFQPGQSGSNPVSRTSIYDSSNESRCICGQEAASRNDRETVHISREDLTECANRVRGLLRIVEDARSMQDSEGSCELIHHQYRASLDDLRAFFQPMSEKRGLWQRMLAKKRKDKIVRPIEISQPASTIKPKTPTMQPGKGVQLGISVRPTLPPSYQESTI
jgi:hypothetical protein